jgi:hypothetical protein
MRKLKLAFRSIVLLIKIGPVACLAGLCSIVDVLRNSKLVNNYVEYLDKEVTEFDEECRSL